MTVRRVAALVVLVLLMTGCNADEMASLRMPTCGVGGREHELVGHVGARTTFLMTQSVPEAGLVPCIDAEALPPDLFMDTMRIDSSSTRLTFLGDWPNDDDMPLRLEVRFTGTCDTTGAVAVPTDEPGTRRLERVERVADGYAGERFYLFDGGCVTYRFDARREGWLEFVHEASQAWTFMPRAEAERLGDVAFGECVAGDPTGLSCDR